MNSSNKENCAASDPKSTHLAELIGVANQHVVARRGVLRILGDHGFYGCGVLRFSDGCAITAAQAEGAAKPPQLLWKAGTRRFSKVYIFHLDDLVIELEENRRGLFLVSDSSCAGFIC